MYIAIRRRWRRLSVAQTMLKIRHTILKIPLVDGCVGRLAAAGD